jgi:hypothetical protein
LYLPNTAPIRRQNCTNCPRLCGARNTNKNTLK